MWAVSLVPMASVPVGVTFISSLHCDIEEVLLLSLGPSKMQWKVLGWLGGMCSSLSCWPGMGLGPTSLPTAANSPCPLLRRTIPLFLAGGTFPPAAQETQEWNRACWSHTDITMREVKSCRCLFSNVSLVQSKQCWEDRDCVRGARLTSVLSHKTAYVGRFWKFSIQRQTNHVGSSQGPEDKAA